MAKTVPFLRLFVCFLHFLTLVFRVSCVLCSVRFLTLGNAGKNQQRVIPQDSDEKEMEKDMYSDDEDEGVACKQNNNTKTAARSGGSIKIIRIQDDALIRSFDMMTPAEISQMAKIIEADDLCQAPASSPKGTPTTSPTKKSSGRPAGRPGKSSHSPTTGSAAMAPY